MIAWKEPCEALDGKTPEDWLRERYPTLGNNAIVEELQIAGFPTATPKAVRRHAEDMGIKKEEKEHIPPKFAAREVRRDTGEFDWRATIKAATLLQDQREAVAFSQSSPIIEIETDEPIALCFSADWHLGAGATDHDTWQRDMEFLLRTPGLYYAVLGDETENMRSFMNVKSIISQVLPPDLQRKVLQEVLTELIASGKALWTTWGNHVHSFDERLLGESLMDDFHRQQGIPHLGDTGLVRLKVGEQTYTILATHKTRYRSYRNALHGAKRLYEITFPADIVVVAHNHQPGHEAFHHYGMARELGMGFGGTSHLVACSTYKTEESNSWAARNFGRAVLTRETAVLWPYERKIEMFDDSESAMERIGGTA